MRLDRRNSTMAIMSTCACSRRLRWEPPAWVDINVLFCNYIHIDIDIDAGRRWSNQRRRHRSIARPKALSLPHASTRIRESALFKFHNLKFC